MVIILKKKKNRTVALNLFRVADPFKGAFTPNESRRGNSKEIMSHDSPPHFSIGICGTTKRAFARAPVIYDPSDHDHRDGDVLASLWKEVASAVNNSGNKRVLVTVICKIPKSIKIIPRPLDLVIPELHLEKKKKKQYVTNFHRFCCWPRVSCLIRL